MDQSKKFEELSGQVRALTERVTRLEKLGRGVTSSEDSESAQMSGVEAPGMETAEGIRPGPLTVSGMTAIFSRFATVSLILALALVLRILTESGEINITVGSLLGIGYASLLEATGWIMYRKSHPFAPIFSISGVLLLFSVVIETHASFGSISSLPAYGVLIVAAAGLAVISRLQKVAIPVCVGTVGVIFAGMSIDFPDPIFLYLAFLMLAVNIMAFSAAALPRCWWLRQVALGSTLLVWMAWAFKLSVALRGGEVIPGNLSLPWFLPSISLMAVFYIVVSYLRMARGELERVGPFDSVLPTLAVVWAYALSYLFFSSSHGDLRYLGAAGILVATALLGLAMLMARTGREGSSGTNIFAFPAAFLLAISFRDVSGESIIALAILSWAALNLAYLSRRWQSPGVRVTSYFLQVTVMGASLMLLASSPTGENAAITIFATAAIAVIAFIQYSMARRVEPPKPSLYFTRWDKGDRSAAALLIVSLAGAFLMFRAGFHVLIFGMLDGTPDAFRSSQSVLINLGAIALFLLASRLRNTEVKMTAVFVTVVGAGKVFLLDFFAVQGIPLVTSVFSFGLAAALGAVVLSRWQRPAAQ